MILWNCQSWVLGCVTLVTYPSHWQHYLCLVICYPMKPLPGYTLPELTCAEFQAQKAAGGCYHCCLTPTSMKWITHMAQNCSGNVENGIPPWKSTPTHAGVAAVLDIPGNEEDTEDDNLDDDYGVVGMSPCPSSVLGDGTDLGDGLGIDYFGFSFGTTFLHALKISLDCFACYLATLV